MNKNYLGDIYKDFYGNDNYQKEDIKVDNDINIDSLAITDNSLELLKKIITYIKDYSLGKEQFIPFHILIETEDISIVSSIKNIIDNTINKYNYIDNIKKKELSLYEEKLDIDNINYLILNIEDINIIDNKNINIFIHKLENNLNKNILFSIGIGNKNNINTLLEKNNNLKQIYKFKIISKELNIKEMYNEVLKEYNATDKEKKEIYNYIENTYKEENSSIYKYELINHLRFYKEVPKIDKKSNKEIFKELDELVGLNKVKKVLHELVDLQELKKNTKDKLNINNINLHFVFLGNPGTGKTTIARIIANILYNIGYIKENKLIEVSSKDLVGEYVGQTAPKTNEVIKRSMNGVLFIDEAYSLAGNKSTYNEEAIATLIQAMENYRDCLVVILAGYSKEMQEFLNSNSGISSRIGYILEFDDYTEIELISIFKSMATKGGFIVKSSAIKELESIINKYKNMNNFGNARFIRNIYEKTIIKHASRVKDKKDIEVLKTITKEDISIENLILE